MSPRITRAQAALFLGLLAACAALPGPARAENGFDTQGLKLFHQTLYNPSVADFAKVYTQAGNGAVVLAGCGALVLFGHDSLAGTGKIAGLAALESGALALGLKYLVNRERPDGPAGRFDSAFPSGHVTVAFAAATVIAARHPKAAPWAFVAAGLVGVSRVYLGRHWPTDALAGAALGYGAGRLALRQAERLGLDHP